jgi:hypothetical protein
MCPGQGEDAGQLHGRSVQHHVCAVTLKRTAGLRQHWVRLEMPLRCTAIATSAMNTICSG